MTRIRRLVADGAFSWGEHVFQRREERDIDLPDILEVLRFGMIDGAITPGDNPGEWKCKVTFRVDRSSRSIGVVCVVSRDVELFLITVEWEDK
jgi:hypothetical protein